MFHFRCFSYSLPFRTSLDQPHEFQRQASQTPGGGRKAPFAGTLCPECAAVTGLYEIPSPAYGSQGTSYKELWPGKEQEG